MQIRYYGDKISNRIAKTPEGFLICQEVPISRTGYQEYYAGEIMDHPVDAKRIIHVYRPSEEVFDIKSLASFEGKPVTNEHPDEDVTPENYQRYSCGHVQNVRPGMGEDANKVVADLYITDPDLISLILSGKREISCGYYAEEKRDSAGKLCQTKIRGNHVAVVNNGRAGSHVCIRDKKPNFERRFDMKRGKNKVYSTKRSRYDNELFDEDEVIDNDLFDEDLEDNDLFDEDIEDNELFDEDLEDNDLFDDEDIDDEDLEDNDLFDDEDLEDNDLFDDEDIDDEDLEDITVDEMFDGCSKKDRRDNDLFDDEDLDDEDIDDEDIEDNELFDEDLEDEDLEDEDLEDEDLEDCDQIDCRDNDLFDEDEIEDEDLEGELNADEMFDDEDPVEDEEIEDDDEFDLVDVDPDDAVEDDDDVEVMETDEVEEKLERGNTLDTRKDAAMREIISAAAGISNPVERKSVQDAVYRAFCKKSQMGGVMKAISKNVKSRMDAAKGNKNTISYKSQQSIYDSFNPHKK